MLKLDIDKNLEFAVFLYRHHKIQLILHQIAVLSHELPGNLQIIIPHKITGIEPPALNIIKLPRLIHGGLARQPRIIQLFEVVLVVGEPTLLDHHVAEFAGQEEHDEGVPDRLLVGAGGTLVEAELCLGREDGYFSRGSRGLRMLIC
jgi:hypothetical protein